MHKNKSRDKAERDKLIHKLKREKKGALREIRKDKDFLGRIKVQQQIKRYVICIIIIHLFIKVIRISLQSKTSK